MKTYTATTEPTAWLRTTALARAQKATLLGSSTLIAGGVVIVPLGRSGANDPIEDRTCDRCRHYCEVDTELMYPFRMEYKVPGGGKILVCGGLCAGCVEREVGEVPA